MNSLSTCSSLPEQNHSIILHAVISAILNLSLKNVFPDEDLLKSFSRYQKKVNKSLSINSFLSFLIYLNFSRIAALIDGAILFVISLDQSKT